ncbi:MAG: LysR family transcriptional regulator [Roseitalea sp.]|jgi:DNA-binding transcriptional LysR family regulator|nr:LysR family transcriptional regulator [Roseitalea sp.]MBO6720811.1 LysR family transcriptional regulator [Roseitalea sp.]MBO6743958.1 LysR family transcriptional regulator [Roseitalea sp.]
MSHKVDVHLLSCLDALVAEAHVTRAAERMNMSQPAMSNALGRLRDLFLDPLLVRTPTGMVPTDRAEQIMDALRPALRTIDATLSASGPFKPAEADINFNIMTTDYGALTVLPKLMLKLQSTAPKVRIGIRYSRPAEVREQLEGGDTSLVLGFFRDLPEGLYSSVIQTDTISCLVRRGHATVKGPPTLEQYMRCRHVYFAGAGTQIVSTIEKLVDEQLSQMGLVRNSVLRIANVMVTPHIVAESDLLAVLPKRAAERLTTGLDVDIHPLPFELPDFKIAMIWHERTHRDPAHRWLREGIRDVVRENQF